MTGMQCFDAAMTLLTEQDSGRDYYLDFALGAVNQLLANCLREDNALRQAEQLPCHPRTPVLASLEDEILYHDAMVREAFPYGLAALLVCDEDKARFNWLASEFAQRLDRHCPVALLPIKEID